MKSNNIDKNIILITIDCLRADHLHCMGYHKNISPTIDFLAKNGVLFTNAFSNAPSTPFSIPSYITSTIAPIDKNPKETIASILKKKGYATAAYNPNPIVFITALGGGAINKGFDTFKIMLSFRKQYALGRGTMRQYWMKFLRYIFKEKGVFYKTFYTIYDKLTKNIPFLLCPREHRIIPKAEDINKEAIDWVKNQKKKFFLWIHYMDVHEPYVPPFYENEKEMLYLITKYRDFPNMLSNQEIQKLIELYDLCIKYTDMAIKNFLEKLKELDCYENTILIISADHGDAFGEHNTFGHGGKFELQVYDEVIHVPIVIYGIEKKGVIVDEQVQLLDLGPAICELIHVPTPPNFFGEKLFSKSEKGMIINCATLIAYKTSNYKLIINKSDDSKNELYDLKQDPKEKINIYNKDPDLKKKMEFEMTALLSKYKKKQELLNIKNFSKI